MRKVQNFLAFNANAKLLNFTDKLKTASGKIKVKHGHVVILPFAVNVILYLSIITFRQKN